MSGCGVGFETTVHAFNFGKLNARVENHLLHVRSREVATSVRADVCETVPLVHAEFAHSNLDVQPVIVVLAHVALGEMLTEHVMVNILAALNLRNQPAARLGECA